MADILSSLQAAAGVSTGNPNAWDISKAYYDAGADAGDVSKAVYAGLSYNVGLDSEYNPDGLSFKPDGTKMYVSGSSLDSILEYNLSAPWNVATASYVSAFSLVGTENDPRGIFFKPDGTEIYIAAGQFDTILQYSLSTAWDITTASANGSVSVAAKESSPRGVFLKSDGTKMYFIGSVSGQVHEYDLSTAWDISSATFVQSFSVATQESIPNDLAFNADGTKMYVVGQGTDAIHEYALSTAWDVSSASFTQTFSMQTQDLIVRGLFFRQDGGAFYMCGSGNTSVYQYTIGGFSVVAQDGSSDDLHFKPDGTKMYIIGTANDKVYEYDLSTAWDITTASFLQDFSVSAQELGPSGLYFKPDGTKMYIVGNNGDEVNEYSLSVAWDVSTASYVQNFSVASQETTPQALSFKADGTKMYIIGSTNDAVYQYSLSSAWDISTASYDSVSFSVASQDGNPSGLYFRDDGLLMFIPGISNNKLYKYTLSSAWDVSTASFSQDFALGITQARGVYFNPDGAQFFVNSITLDKVFSYLISEE